ncbi:NADH-quinone oxidoreductase subunit C [Sphingosinicellaceae bacterium]|nr:NADH-quinone oxidoreductase subunit C [Sphingosinicellaceae bacterium]
MTAHWPLDKPDAGFDERIRAAFPAATLTEHVGEWTLTIARDGLIDVATRLRDDFAFEQLIDIAGVDYPERPERFEVNYLFLSLTANRRIRVKLFADDVAPVASLTGLWTVADWWEREVYDLYGVLFSGHPDLRRILTDYGFSGHPFRKDFPLTGHVELRYSEEHKRVVYEPVKLAQDFRSFDFLSPWEGTDYVLPGDEKAPQVPTVASPAPATVSAAPVAPAAPVADAATPAAPKAN